MSKTLTDVDLAEIVHKAVHDMGIIDCADAYEHFLTDLAELVTSHFGGDLYMVMGMGPDENGSDQWSCEININDCVPDDGGIYQYYDMDVEWKDGEEHERVQ